MILADTSAWIEYDRATGSMIHLRMRALIDEGRNLAVTDPVIMEVLIGARTAAQEEELLRLLTSFQMLPFDAASDFPGAIRIYRRCREGGFTPRGTADCMIVAVALRTDASLLTSDIDLVRIARIMGIPLDRASIQAP